MLKRFPYSISEVMEVVLPQHAAIVDVEKQAASTPIMPVIRYSRHPNPAAPRHLCDAIAMPP